jgi:hypothetical protein
LKEIVAVKTRFLFIMLAGWLVTTNVPAQSTWTNLTGTNAWSVSGNWDTPPSSGAGTALSFTNASSGTSYGASNDLANPFLLTALTFNNASTNKTISLLGNPLAFTNNGATLPTVTQMAPVPSRSPTP